MFENTDPRDLSHDEAYERVKSVLRLCEPIAVKERKYEKRFWRTFGLLLSQVDDALTELADLGKVEFFFMNGDTWVQLKSNIANHPSTVE